MSWSVGETCLLPVFTLWRHTNCQDQNLHLVFRRQEIGYFSKRIRWLVSMEMEGWMVGWMEDGRVIFFYGYLLFTYSFLSILTTCNCLKLRICYWKDRCVENTCKPLVISSPSFPQLSLPEMFLFYQCFQRNVFSILFIKSVSFFLQSYFIWFLNL